MDLPDFSSWTSHSKLISWIEEMLSLCTPDHVHLCDGSDQEYNTCADLLVEAGSFVRLNPEKRPNSYACFSDPRDVARVEARTFICSQKEVDAGPTNNWVNPNEMKEKMNALFAGCMKGRTAYVIPFSMGPIGSPLAMIGVQITDSPYVVMNMKIMTRMGREALGALGSDGFFVPCMHSVGLPLESGQKDVAWPCNPEQTHVVHYPEERSIWSFGSGYGGNALLGKKCLALRIASNVARDEGWLAEHMLIVGITNPEGAKKYIAAAFPSACGKTNLAMLKSTLKGWKVECVGDDIAWMRPGKDGKLYAINPESGFFGVAPGTSPESNPNALESCSKNSIFTNVALTDDKDVWWEGLTEKAPEHLIDWKGNDWTPESPEPAAHPNSRFTAPIDQCPVLDEGANWANGVPIEAIIFGGRRAGVMPLAIESLSWDHGTFLGASVSSEMTAAAAGTMGKLRHDPFAMLPFCGYNMGDYFGHWLSVGKTLASPPKIFHVNWFRKGEDGSFLWPGFGENIRVIKWIFERLNDDENGVSTPIGIVPETLDTSGLKLSNKILEILFHVDKHEHAESLEELREYFKIFKDHLPQGLVQQMEALEERLLIS